MDNDKFGIVLHNVLADRFGREFVRVVLAECGIDLCSGISYRTEKTAHEFGLDLLHKIMYNDTEQLSKLISEQKALEVNNGRGNGGTDD
jgi:hypothetical protein